ncbi:2OG-Fe(II) oxygenase [Deminuibacter soli]|uniref:2OG-Fe(II) oxygenase n=1 Tax=Deminuibacter soli TaxID=2291815 RepID=A0A3E1NQH0_9BACT|nr:2OG-Fe(II) oxygenase [Deminuibacter soli]RFM30171.1 2OG-Fe(II) oxygenase [Deminuibacter soli]
MNFINRSVEALHGFADEHKAAYTTADPFPNIYFDNFFNPDMLKQVLSEFPDMTKNADIKFNDHNQVKLASKGEYRFGDQTRLFMHYLNSQPFLEFLTKLTGIDNLIPDPTFEGGGCHQIQRGGLLKIHADFNKQPHTKLDRRLNVLVYLNEDWNEDWGGHFELWDTNMQGCRKKILPLFNRMAIFSTTSNSYHGHPNVLNCPPERTRKSLALYYYTNGRPAEEVVPDADDHNTLFRNRPEDRKFHFSSSLKRTIKLVTPPIVLQALKFKTN